jgi:hypothetical protein
MKRRKVNKKSKPTKRRKTDKVSSIEYSLRTRYPESVGSKILMLYEVPKRNKPAKTAMKVYTKDWSFEELADYLDELQEMIWEREYPDEAMLKKYIEFTHSEGSRLPRSIRVPSGVIEMIQHERKLQQQQREKERKEISESK